MPGFQRHLSKAEENENLADTMATLPHRPTDWEVTMLFYPALHYVDAFLATRDIHPKNHYERSNLLAGATNFARPYRTLLRRSMNARYHLYRFTPREVNHIRNGPFRRVKEGILALLPDRT